ncbi:MAG: hypothetical protein ACI4F9_10225 [Lachnospiraceae bacterium]
MTSEIESEVENMCNLSELVERQGMEQGILETNIKAIKNLMETFKLTAEQAMEVLKIPMTDRQDYYARL